MKHPRVARRYAMALMTVAEERQAIDRIEADLEVIAATIRGSHELQLLLMSPVVSLAKKRVVFRELFGQRVGKEAQAFLDLLVTKRREGVLLEVAEQYAKLRDDKYGIINVDVRTAVEMPPAQGQRLQQELERYTGKSIRVRFSLDHSIRGGLLMQIGDTVLDASVQHQLDLLRRKFLEGGPASN